MKEICLNILSYVFISVLLIYSAIYEWKQGSKFISVLTSIVAIFMIWNAIENVKNYKQVSL